MLCWVSAKAGEAIFLSQGRLSLMKAGTTAAAQECSEGRLHQLLTLAPDVQQHDIPDGGKNSTELLQILLDRAWRLEWALHALAATVDRSLSPQLREEARRLLSELFQDHDLLVQTRRLFLSVPIPIEADTDWAKSEEPVGRLVADAVSFRDGAVAAQAAWLQVAFRASESPERVAEFRRAAVLSGGLEAIRESLAAGRDDSFLEWVSNRDWRLGERDVIQDWARETFFQRFPDLTFNTSAAAHDTSRFRVGDRVIYPNYGLGIVERIEDKTILGTTSGFYHLRILSNDATVLVPVSNADGVGLRRAIGDEGLERLFGRLGDGKIDNHHDWKGRFKDNSDKMRSGSIYEIADVLKSLTFLGKSKNLSFREKRMLDRAKFLIISEVSEVTGETPAAVELRVDSALERTFATRARTPPQRSNER